MEVFPISASWLIDGLERVAAKHGPPSGLEFEGVEMTATIDPVKQLADRFGSAPHRAAMRRAVAGALSHHSLSPVDPEVSLGCLVDLIRLCSIFGSEEAARTLIGRLEQGAFSGGDDRLVEALALFGARQVTILRERFEAALRASASNLTWASSNVVPFLEKDISESPTHWLAALTLRLADAEAEKADGFNAAQEILRSVARHPLAHRQLIDGLALGDPDRDVGALRMVFDGTSEDFSVFRRYHRGPNGETDIYRTDDYFLLVRIGGREAVEVRYDDILRTRDIVTGDAGRSLDEDDYRDLDDAERWEAEIQTISGVAPDAPLTEVS